MSQAKSAWQRFEEIAQELQSELAPTAAVTRNEKLRGRSSVLHQCDVVIRSKVGQYEFIGVMECKDHSTKVDLDIARSFAAVIDDLGVSQGVLVSARGFTDDALRFAKCAGILTYTLADAESTKWRDAALVPVVANFIFLKTCEVEFKNPRTGNKFAFNPDYDVTAVPLVDTVAGRRITVKQYLEEHWDAVCCNPILTEPRDHADVTGRYALVTPPGLVNVHSVIKFIPGCMYHYGYIPLQSGRAFIDADSGGVLLGHEFDTGDIDFHEIRMNWPYVGTESELPLKRPVFKLHTPILFRLPDQPIDGVRLESRRIPNREP